MPEIGTRSFATFDALLLLKDAGAVTADGAATVGGAARVLDLGPARMDGKMVVDVSALDVADLNETYTVQLQASNDAAFGSGNVFLAQVVVAGTGRKEVPFSTLFGGTIYRYVRVMTDVAGTTPSVNFTAFLAKGLPSG